MFWVHFVIIHSLLCFLNEKVLWGCWFTTTLDNLKKYSFPESQNHSDPKHTIYCLSTSNSDYLQLNVFLDLEK